MRVRGCQTRGVAPALPSQPLRVVGPSLNAAVSARATWPRACHTPGLASVSVRLRSCSFPSAVKARCTRPSKGRCTRPSKAVGPGGLPLPAAGPPRPAFRLWLCGQGLGCPWPWVPALAERNAGKETYRSSSFGGGGSKGGRAPKCRKGAKTQATP